MRSKKRIPLKKSPRRRKKAARQKPRSWKIRLLRSMFLLGVAFAVCWGLVGAFYYAWALTFDLKQLAEMPQSSLLFDKDGKFYSRLAGGENRQIVPFDSISNDFVNALIAREDNRFYWHHGVDPIGILRAIVRNLRGIRQGGSTITQQLARNSFPLGGRNLHRKLLEAALALRIETELSKEQILEYYMNRIYFGSGCYGLEAASQTYFGKPARKLNLSESALIAGLIRSPNRLSPFNDLPSAVRQRNVVLNRMFTLGFITKDRLRQALNSPVQLSEKDLRPKSGWAMEAIYRELEWILPRDVFDEGGLRVYTSIDPRWQQVAQSTVLQYLNTLTVKLRSREAPRAAKSKPREEASPLPQAAVVIIDNHDGGIRAIIGGNDYSQTQFDRASLARRQIGSAVKPFLYTLAFERGLRPDTLVDDSRILLGELPFPFSSYSPLNADGLFGGIRPAGEGLIFSRNTMTVRIAARVGLKAFGDTLKRLDLLDRDATVYPSACLGAFECSVKDVAAAYTVFTNQGAKLQPFLIDRVETGDGRILYRATHGSIPVFNSRAIALTDSLLHQIVDRGPARKLGLNAAG
ncbi:MAG: hypothetical protein C5B47_00865, partial [Verrucomicrobia bacterium]